MEPKLKVSIHAPRAGRDPQSIPPSASPSFQSTRPARGATAGRQLMAQQSDVSIHAPRAGRDPPCGRC